MDFPYEKDSKERMPYEHYMEIYRGLNPEDISSRANIPYNAESRTFTLRLMGVTYQVSWPDYEVRHLDREPPTPGSWCCATSPRGRLRRPRGSF